MMAGCSPLAFQGPLHSYSYVACHARRDPSAHQLMARCENPLQNSICSPQTLSRDSGVIESFKMPKHTTINIYMDYTMYF